MLTPEKLIFQVIIGLEIGLILPCQRLLLITQAGRLLLQASKLSLKSILHRLKVGKDCRGLIDYVLCLADHLPVNFFQHFLDVFDYTGYFMLVSFDLFKLFFCRFDILTSNLDPKSIKRLCHKLHLPLQLN
jgi:hypothetical protein